MSRQDEEYLKTILGINFKMDEIKSTLADSAYIINSIPAIIEKEMVKGFKELMNKKDLKIVLVPDKEVLVVLDDINERTKQNANAILTFNSSFIKSMQQWSDKLEAIKNMQKSQSREQATMPYPTPNSQLQDIAPSVIDKKTSHNGYYSAAFFLLGSVFVFSFEYLLRFF